MAGGYGSRAKPVSLDPITTIVEVGWPTKADVVIIRTGTNIVAVPSDGGAHRPAAFRRTKPAKDASALWEDARKDDQWVGYVFPPTNLDDPPEPPNTFYYDEPQLSVPMPSGGGGIPSLTTFPLATPSADQWGPKDASYNSGSYLWFCGWAGSGNQMSNNSCLVNARKMRHDYAKEQTKDDGTKKLVEPSEMGVKVVYDQNRVPSTSSDTLLCELAAYRFNPTYKGSGDFYLVSDGIARVNEAKLIARKVIKPDLSVLLPAVEWGYDFKKQITFTGGTEISQQEYVNYPDL